LLRKNSFKEMNVQKFRNFVITEFVQSGIHCTPFSSLPKSLKIHVVSYMTQEKKMKRKLVSGKEKKQKSKNR